MNESHEETGLPHQTSEVGAKAVLGKSVKLHDYGQRGQATAAQAKVGGYLGAIPGNEHVMIVDVLTPSGLTDEEVDLGLQQIVADLSESSHMGERTLGILLDTAIRFAPEKRIEVMRTMSEELQDALKTLDRRWMNLVGE